MPTFLLRIMNIFRSVRLDDDAREEVETHLALIEEEERASGAASDDARRNARLRFGNPSVYREQMRDANVATWLDNLWQDLKFASRQLLRNPGFALGAILLLALGIGVNTAIFTIIRSVVLRPLALPESDHVVSILQRTKGGFETPQSWPDLLDIREANSVFASTAGFQQDTTFIFSSGNDSSGNDSSGNDNSGSEALNIKGSRVTPDYFATLGVQPIAGRVFDAAEGEGRNRVALLREDFWKTKLGADPAILQKRILIDGQSAAVVGILPAAFRFPSNDSVIWMPLVPVGMERNRGFHAFSMVGRLKPGVTLSQAQADLEIVMSRLAREYPDQNGGHSAKVIRLQDWSLDKHIRDRLVFLQIAALALFLMACANVSSLLLARYSARRAEFGIRMALGASRMRQMRQHVAESLLLTGLGCAAAVGLAWAGVRFLVWLYGEQMPRASEISPDWKLVGAVVAATIGGAVAMGLTTALHEQAKDFGTSARESNRTTAGIESVLTRKSLIVFQIACAVLLLAATGETLQSFRALLQIDVGFDRSHLTTMRVDLPSAKYRQGAEIAGFFEKTAEEISSMPGVQKAAAINMLPIAEWGFNGSVNVEGLPPLDRSFFAEYRWVTSDYFSAMEIPLLRGRLFLPEEMSGKNRAAIVNETMARKVWGGKDPLGAHISMFSPEWITVVGIARDVRQTSVSAPPSPEVYMPARSYANGRPIWSVVVRSELPAQSLVPGIRRAIHSEDPGAAVDHIETMDEVVADSVSAQRIVAALLLCFAGLALILAGLGLYSLVTFTAAARLPELAIRGALGASPRALIQLVGREGVTLVAAGLVTGLAAMIPLRPLLAKYVFEVNPMSVPAFGLVLLVLLAVGGVAVLVPALRAVRVDPMQALRRE